MDSALAMRTELLVAHSGVYMAAVHRIVSRMAASLFADPRHQRSRQCARIRNEDLRARVPPFFLRVLSPRMIPALHNDQFRDGIL